MMTIGAIGFLQPWVLAALAALPAIWWLLRLTPPSPQVVVFPPTRLLKDLKTTEETPAHSPWWLTLLRMLLAALLIFALARPVLNPDQQSFTGEGPLLLVIDNGWASAAHWPERREAIEAAIERAGRDSRTVVLAFTAPGQPISDPMSPEQARERVGGMMPEPYAPDRAALAAALEKQLGGKTDYSVLWMSDGLDYGEGDAFAKSLAKLAGGHGSFAVLRPEGDDAALALGQSAGDKGELAARVMSASQGPRSGVVRALTGRGEPLGEAAFSIGETAREAIANFDLPLEIRNQVARIEIAGERSAGAVHLLDGRSQWHRVGIVSGESREAAQPLLSPLYYVQRALSPYADVITPSEGNVANAIHSLIEQKVSTIVLADIGKLVAGTQEELETWLKSGGVLIRFAGPRLEQGGDELLPVALRRGGRSLGGSLSWSTPQPLAPFEEKSPFRGLTVPEDVKINRQVLADPTVASESEVWATLADGTPLVTASKQGQGFIVLFHVTANSDWSNLPLSGLFVEMLRRVVALGPSQVTIDTGKQDATVEASPAASTTPAASTSALPPLQTLDGFGQLGSPPLRAAPIAPDKLDTLGSGPRSSARLLRPVGCGARLQPHHRQDRAQAARRSRRIKRDRRLHHEEANGARALALSRRHRTVRHRYPSHAGVERRRTVPPPRRRDRRHLARAGAPARIQPSRRGAGRSGNDSADGTGSRGHARARLSRRFRPEGIVADPSRLRHHRRSRNRSHQRGRLERVEQGVARADRARAGRSHGRRYR